MQVGFNHLNQVQFFCTKGKLNDSAIKISLPTDTVSFSSLQNKIKKAAEEIKAQIQGIKDIKAK